MFVYRMGFDKARWSCPENNDQHCAQNSARWSHVGVKGLSGGGLISESKPNSKTKLTMQKQQEIIKVCYYKSRASQNSRTGVNIYD